MTEANEAKETEANEAKETEANEAKETEAAKSKSDTIETEVTKEKVEQQKQDYVNQAKKKKTDEEAAAKEKNKEKIDTITAKYNTKLQANNEAYLNAIDQLNEKFQQDLAALK
eukprot:137546_1